MSIMLTDYSLFRGLINCILYLLMTLMEHHYFNTVMPTQLLCNWEGLKTSGKVLLVIPILERHD